MKGDGKREARRGRYGSHFDYLNLEVPYIQGITGREKEQEEIQDRNEGQAGRNHVTTSMYAYMAHIMGLSHNNKKAGKQRGNFILGVSESKRRPLGGKSLITFTFAPLYLQSGR